MRNKIKKAFVNLSFRQLAGLIVSAFGSILLARILGLEIFGLYAVSSFFVNLFGSFISFGTGAFLIRIQGEPEEVYIRTAFTMVLIKGFILLLFIYYILAPIISSWYDNEYLYDLVFFSSIAVFLSSVFKISTALLEKEMAYGKVGIIEVTGIVSFYIPAVVSAFFGFGVFSIVIGELFRGISSIIAFLIRPFTFRIVLCKKTYLEMFRFGFSYLSAMIPWTINNALNPVVVGKIAGMEAAGIIRLSEGIVNHLTFFTAITDRISYPLFAEYGDQKERIRNAVEKGRIYQFLLACIPLFVFSALSYKLVPLLYGDQWHEVTNVLLLLSLTYGINTIFGLYSSSLIVAGKNWDVMKFTVINGVCLWLLSPVTVYFVGYLGYPVAILASSFSYYIMHKSFVKNYGAPVYRIIFKLLFFSYLIMLTAWLVKNIFFSLIILLSLSALYLGFSKEMKSLCYELLSIIKGSKSEQVFAHATDR